MNNLAVKKDEYSDNFEWMWKKKPKRNRPDNKRKAYKAWCCRIKQGHTEREMTIGVNFYGVQCAKEGKIGTEFVMMMATFFGPDCHFTDYQEPVEEGVVAVVDARSKKDQLKTMSLTENLKDTSWAF